MTHLKRQKLILSTQIRGYNTQFLLYPSVYILFFTNFQYFTSTSLASDNITQPLWL